MDRRNVPPSTSRTKILTLSNIAVAFWTTPSTESSGCTPESSTRIAACEVKGDYAFLWNLVGLPDGTKGFSFMAFQSRREALSAMVYSMRSEPRSFFTSASRIR